MEDRINLSSMCQRQQKIVTKMGRENNQSRVEELLQINLVTTLNRPKSKLSVELSKLFGDSSVFKVMNNGCITTSHNLTKADIPIVLSKSQNSKYKVCNRILEKAYRVLHANISKKNDPNSYSRTCNQFHIILRLFDVLANFPFTASETIGDYYL